MPTLLTHNDLDGVGCAVVWQGTGSGGVELVANGAIDDRVRSQLAVGADLVVSDHGVTEQTASLVEAHLANGGGFVLLDHHRSSRHLAGHPWATVDEARSATGLMFDHLGRPPAFAEFSALVEDHDLWRHADPRSARLAALLGQLGSARFIARFAADPSVGFRPAEELVLELEAERRADFLDRKVAQSRVLEVGEIRWGITYADQYQSDLAERLMEDLGVTATAIVNASKRTVSLRGRGVDVAPLAERNGGGGHARAAAFSFAGRPLEVVLAAFEAALDAELGG